MPAAPDVFCAFDEMRAIGELVPHPMNPNTHPLRQIEMLAEIISVQGWRAPITVSERSGFVVRGHGRLAAARELGLLKVPVDLQPYDSEASEYADLVADNRIAELAEIDDDQLAKTLRAIGEMGMGLEVAGFDCEALAELGIAEDAAPTAHREAEEATDDSPTRAEELREKWKTEMGQLWKLGEHSLACGDSLDVDLRGECKTLIFDPEWDKMPSALTGFDHVLAFADGATIGKVIERYGSPTWLFVWDCCTCWFTKNRPLRRMKICAWYGDLGDYNFDGWHYGEPGESGEISNSRGKHHYKSDPRGKHLADVFKTPIVQLHANGEHSHSKPLDWIALLIANCTRGDVYDPFAGSGTTLLACERLNRKSVSVEIDPGYVAVIIERWQQKTQGKPILT